ncbi:MAG TPA: hypothetical protein VKU86_02615 [Acidimicrobiales bacterium]|nr:hypothetical protein [Acidimicrobiales bacterium]
MAALPHFPAGASSVRRAVSAALRFAVVATLILAAMVTSATPASSGDARPRVRHAALTSSQSVPAYWTVASDGGVFAFGGLPFYGSMGGVPLNQPMVGIAPTTDLFGADGKGYWTVASDGGVFSFGSARFHGSMGGTPLNRPMVGIAADPATGGYWTVASDGGVFAFDAPFFGSMGSVVLNRPIVAMASTPDGGGYWLFASDGGVFAFGDAPFHGSMGSTPLVRPVVGAAAPDGGGYWMVASDGGIFAFGDAGYFGSLGGHALSRPVAAMAAADPGGYWLTDTNGAVTSFGDAGYFGSAPQQLARPMVAMADGPASGSAVGGGVYPSGSYGYDVSVFQENPPSCNMALPSGHTIGIVQSTGDGGGAPNPCLSQEAHWAGAGLNLYVYMVGWSGGSPPGEPGCGGTYATQCDFGYESTLQSFQYAQRTGVNPLVTWWLDIEPDPSWSSDTQANAATVQGGINALRDQGVNNVGVYTSPGTWNGIVGNYQPAVPTWIAWWTNDGPGNCANIRSYASAHNDRLPTGPVWVTQYTDQANGQSLDGDYAC